MKKIATILCLMNIAALTKAAVIADWSFENSPPADLNNSTAISGIAADSGSGTASGSHASAATDWSTPAGDGSANSLSANTWASGDYYQFTTSTVGYNAITLSWEQTSSVSTLSDFKLVYSTDGSTFLDVTGSGLVNGNSISGNSYTVGTTSWSSSAATAGSHTTVSFDLSSMSAVNDDSTLYFQLVTSSSPATTATDRIDDFNISGNLSAVPEPPTWGAITALGLLGICAVREWRQRKLA